MPNYACRGDVRRSCTKADVRVHTGAVFRRPEGLAECHISGLSCVAREPTARGAAGHRSHALHLRLRLRWPSPASSSSSDELLLSLVLTYMSTWPSAKDWDEDGKLRLMINWRAAGSPGGRITR